MSPLNHKGIDKVRGRLAPHSPHLSVILDGALISFFDTANPLRFSNAATNLRELLRELFAVISPDACILASSWFVPDAKSATGVTRLHRVLFAIYSYLDPQHFPENFASKVDALAKQIPKQVGKLSAFTHITADSLAASEVKAVACFDLTIDLFLRLFAAIDFAREHLRDALQNELQERLSYIFISDFFAELDILSSHTCPQDAEDVEVEISEIGKEVISFTGTGSVLCDLQHGSDGDCARGDGIEFSDSFPFTFSGEARTENPRDVTISRDGILVDTSAFYE